MRELRKYTYIMRKSKDSTLEALKENDARILNIKVYKSYNRNHDKKRTYGRIVFDRKLQLWDAMEAGLIPSTKEKVG